MVSLSFLLFSPSFLAPISSLFLPFSSHIPYGSSSPNNLHSNSTNLPEVIKTVTVLPAISAHVLFHSTFSLSNSLPTSTHPFAPPSTQPSNQSLHDKVSKVESLLSLLCSTLTHLTTFDTISADQTFKFLANFADILAYFLASSPSYALKQLNSPTTLPSSTLTQRETVEDLVESLLTILLVRQPFLLAVLAHPTQLSFLTSGRTSLFPSFSPSSSFSARYPFVMFLALTSIPTTTLGKILGGPARGLIPLHITPSLTPLFVPLSSSLSLSLILLSLHSRTVAGDHTGSL